MNLPLVKICEACGADYRRPTGTGRVTDEKWAARKYCSGTCGFSAAGKAHGQNSNGAPAVFDAKGLQTSIATKALLDRQMDYYRRIASDRGLNDVWEAAVMLGMAA